VTAEPAYKSDLCTVYHGVVEQLLPTFSAGEFDAVVTDPPYGIGEARANNPSRGGTPGGWYHTSRDYGVSDWDDAPCSPEAIAEMRRVSRWQVIFGGNYFGLPASSCWLVWDKMNGQNDFADCELAWTNLPKAVRQIRHRWHGMIREGREERFHPTQKPLAVMRWCLSHLPADTATILDPFGGSGTTAVACVQTGRRCVLIEREERYVEIAVRRIREVEGVGSLFEKTTA
jgi:DNA modification methylase